jgi:hypothetical protein
MKFEGDDSVFGDAIMGPVGMRELTKARKTQKAIR